VVLEEREPWPPAEINGVFSLDSSSSLDKWSESPASLLSLEWAPGGSGTNCCDVNKNPIVAKIDIIVWIPKTYSMCPVSRSSGSHAANTELMEPATDEPTAMASKFSAWFNDRTLAGT